MIGPVPTLCVDEAVFRLGGNEALASEACLFERRYGLRPERTIVLDVGRYAQDGVPSGFEAAEFYFEVTFGRGVTPWTDRFVHLT